MTAWEQTPHTPTRAVLTNIATWIDHTGLTKTQSLNPLNQNKMVKYLPRAWAARWASFQRADITEIIIETCSRNWWRDAAAATLTLQGSRQALLSGACLSAPRDCNCICRVILHRSDPSVLWKAMSSASTRNPEGLQWKKAVTISGFPAPQNWSKSKTRDRGVTLKGKSGLCLSSRGLMAV